MDAYLQIADAINKEISAILQATIRGDEKYRFSGAIRWKSVEEDIHAAVERNLTSGDALTEQDEELQSLFKLCDQVTAERDALAEQVRKMREALEWYGKKAAEFAVWDQNPSLAEPAFQDLSNDAGQRALKVLGCK